MNKSKKINIIMSSLVMVLIFCSAVSDALDLDTKKINSTSDMFGGLVDSFNHQEPAVRGMIKWILNSLVLGAAIFFGAKALINIFKGEAGKKIGNAEMSMAGIHGNAILIGGVLIAFIAIVVGWALLESL